MLKCMIGIGQRDRRGQTIIEVTAVLLSLIFFTILVFQFTMIWQSKLVARYAAYMTARSLQVWGTAPDFTWEDYEVRNPKRQQPPPIYFKVFEDIYTCALPWVSVPSSDLGGETQDEYAKACGAEGQRSYGDKPENLNLYKGPSDKDGPLAAVKYSLEEASETVKLDRVAPGFIESIGLGPDPGIDRPLRYGVLRAVFKVPILFPGIMESTQEKLGTGEIMSQVFVGGVYVPLLFNPGVVAATQNGDL